MKELISILGSTGSIGQNTLDVIRQHADRYEVYALVAGRNVQQMISDVQEFKPKCVVMADTDSAALVAEEIPADVTVLSGTQAMVDAVTEPTVQLVMAAIVGAAGLVPSIAAAQAGKKVLLANKESLVVAGELFMTAVRDNGATLLPIDSEHNAIFQCLPNGQFDRESGISKILLTGSGGPFRELALDEFDGITPARAIAHPNWSMGPKISVDSATMMNKGLELIEACWLFDVTPKDVEIVLHPQSIIHSMVQYVDGSVIAQMGNPDMRTPIAYGMAWPERLSSGVADLDFFSMANLTFSKPDAQRYPALGIAADAFNKGGTIPAVMNAANEVAVQAFLDGRISFVQITKIVEATVAAATREEVVSIDQLLEVDKQARLKAKSLLDLGG